MENKSEMAAASRSFSFFGKGWRSADGKTGMPKSPADVWSVLQAYHFITGPQAKEPTQRLRIMMESYDGSKELKQKMQEFKLMNFTFATFGGVFSQRKAGAILQDSGLMTIDIDGLASDEQVLHIKELLVADERIRTALCFVSPSGRGVKWIAEIPERWRSLSFKEKFQKFSCYLVFQYGIVVDKSGSDICRACYLPWDPDCYIHPAYQSAL